MVDRLALSVPCKAEYVGTVRMALAHAANNAGFDIDAIDDIKVAVSEACTNVILHSESCESSNFDVIVELDEERLTIVVKDCGTGFGPDEYVPPVLGETGESGLGIFIIKELMDEVDICSEPGKGTKIRMSKVLQNLNG